MQVRKKPGAGKRKVVASYEEVVTFGPVVRGWPGVEPFGRRWSGWALYFFNIKH